MKSPPKRKVVLTAADAAQMRMRLEAECHRAKDKESFEKLEEELENASIVDPKSMPSNVVTINSKILLRDLDTKEQVSYALVLPIDASIESGKISIMTPIGIAVLGRQSGDIVELKTPGRVRRLRIESILYQPEASGNYYL